MKGLLKKIIVKKDCIIFLSHDNDMKVEILKPIPVTRFVKMLRQYSKEHEYVNTGSFSEFVEKSINTDPELVKEIKDDVDQK